MGCDFARYGEGNPMKLVQGGRPGTNSRTQSRGPTGCYQASPWQESGGRDSSPTDQLLFWGQRPTVTFYIWLSSPIKADLYCDV